MTNIIRHLLTHFPDSAKLSYEEFIHKDEDDYGSILHDYDENQARTLFDLISRPWPEICWLKVVNMDTAIWSLGDSWMLPAFLNKQSFIHVFPSLVNFVSLSEYEKTSLEGLLEDSFVGELNLREVRQTWKKDFYFSLHDDVKRIINLVLHMGGYDDEIESYWRPFRDTLVSKNVPVSQKTVSDHSLCNQVAPDFNLKGVDMAFSRIEAGRFMMGSKVDERYYGMYGKSLNIKYYDPLAIEKVHHTVHISRPFYMAQYPVTQVQWLKVMSDNPSYFVRNDEHPVENISWNDAQEFIARLNTQGGWPDGPEAYESARQFIARLNKEAGLDEETGYVFRLPTEAEWEYACRAVSENDPERETKENWRWFFGDDPAELEHYAWFGQNADLMTHPVGQKRPNPWGLYDLYGNVWEWVWDYHGEYPDREVTDPSEPLNRLASRVVRGGSFHSPIRDVRSARHYAGLPQKRCGFAGLRLVLAPRLAK